MTRHGGDRPAVEIDGLTVEYGGCVAVRDVSLAVPHGELTVLVGPSGCGKTSLLRTIAGFEVPVAGTVRIAGEVVAAPNRWVAPEKRRVGMMFQQGALFPHLNVWDNVRYGLKGQRDRDATAGAALDLVGLDEKRGRYPDELSGGEQQRLALARALAPQPSIVLLDEPFASLDSDLRRRLRDQIRSILRAAEATAVLVTHDQEEALTIADTVVVMKDGRILQAGSPDEIYHRPADLETARLIGDVQLIACEVTAGTARCRLGTVPCSGAEGRGLMLVRPEDLVATPGDSTPRGVESQQDPCVGRVVRRRFFGHDLLDEVALADGEIVKVRMLSGGCVDVGETVRLRLRARTFRTFPSPDDA